MRGYPGMPALLNTSVRTLDKVHPFEHVPGDMAQGDFFEATVGVNGYRHKAYMFIAQPICQPPMSGLPKARDTLTWVSGRLQDARLKTAPRMAGEADTLGG